MIPFIQISKEFLVQKNLFNIILEKYKIKYTYYCQCKSADNMDMLTTKIKYNIDNFSNFLFIIFDMEYIDLETEKNDIYKLVEDKLIFGYQIEYKLEWIISCPFLDHYNCIIFNPRGKTIDSNFNSNLNYYHDGLKNNGKITLLKDSKEWKLIGLPYILIYKKIEF